jgi:hypothetical protein
MHFATMAKWLEPAKLTYACSADYLDSVDVVNLSPEHKDFLKDIHNPIFKQTVRDFMVNKQFRKDYWVKGSRLLTSLEQAISLREQHFLLTAHRADVTLKITGPLGEAILTNAVYSPVLDLMADHKIRSLAQIEQAVKDAGITFAQLVQSVMVLCNNEVFSTVQDDAFITYAKKHTDKLNNHLMLKARSHNDLNYLASPVTGGGIEVGRFHQIFLMAIQQGKNKSEDLAAFTDQILTSQGQKIIKDGKPIETTEQQLTELTTTATQFSIKQLPILKALQIV